MIFNIKTHIKVILLKGILSFFSYLYAGELGVSPMYFDFNTTPGSTHEFELTISGKKDGQLQLTPYQVSQASSGHMTFIKVSDDLSKDKLTPANWFIFEKTKYKFKQGETLKIPVKVKIPKGTLGSQFATIMVEEVKDPKKSDGIGIKVRYAVVISANIKSKKKQRVKLKLDQLDVIFHEGKLIAKINVNNTSNYQSIIAGKIYIRDANKKLIEKIPVNSKSAWERQYPATLIYPKNTIMMYGIAEKINLAGKYQISFRGQYAKKKVYKKGSVNITKAMLPATNNQNILSNSVFSNQQITVKPDKYGRTFNIIKIHNPYDEPITINLVNKKKQPWQKSYSYNTLNQIIEPKRKSAIIFKQELDLSKVEKIPKKQQIQFNVLKKDQTITDHINLTLEV
ncbi:hypothetical protein L3V83_12990 [Thiotrichales bacterium 19X7-9]|nr:hypothetical protein [Thiotrichales bacterium 19X7-9]